MIVQVPHSGQVVTQHSLGAGNLWMTLTGRAIITFAPTILASGTWSKTSVAAGTWEKQGVSNGVLSKTGVSDGTWEVD